MKFSRGATVALFAAAIALAMGLALRNGFVYDDLPAIVENTRVTDPSRWHTIIRAPYWLGTLWRPFTVSMYALQWFAGHGTAWFFHLTSLLIYLAVGVALHRLMLRLGAGQFAATTATLLFLVHPVHVEAVANSVGQAELWAALALLGTIIVYLRARERHAERNSVIPLLLLVGMAIMSKEQGFIAPVLLTGAEWILLADRGESFRARVRLLIPVTGLSILLFIVRGILLNSNIGETAAVALRALGPLGRAETFLAVIPEWARLVVWPLHLQADYGPPGIPVGGPLGAQHLLGAGLLIGFVALFAVWRTRNRVGAFGLFLAAIALAPVSNLLTPTGIVMAERVLFLPTAGLAIALAAALSVRKVATDGAIAPAPLDSRLALALAVTWGALLTVRSATRVPTWQSQERFFTDITVDGANAYRGWKVAAEFWDGEHQRPRAIADLRRSIELWPHDYEVFERLGQIYRQDGHCDLAIPILTAGVDSSPDAVSIRAKLVECLLTEQRWDRAAHVADVGVALGLDEFKPMQLRVKKLRERADTVAVITP